VRCLILLTRVGKFYMVPLRDARSARKLLIFSFLMMPSISRPTLILDKNKCLRNIEAMSQKAQRSKCEFAPHFKTHQSAEIGEWFRDFGVHSITVSSVQMARYFAGHGWKDITIAFPINVREINEIAELAKTVSLHVLISGAETADILSKCKLPDLGAYIEIDTGHHRSGVPSDSTDIAEILQSLNHSGMQFSGFLTHSGQAYKARSLEELTAIFDATRSELTSLKRTHAADHPSLRISLGDTPTCSAVSSFEGIDSIRPGNFVFYDLMQQQIGSCTADQIAVALACPVVARYSGRNEFVLYCGAIHLSKEMLTDTAGDLSFGAIVHFHGKGWGAPLPSTRILSVSQEHAVVKTTTEILRGIRIGDVLGVLPVHSCLTAQQMGSYHTTDNKLITTMNSR
jgi:D-serine deaminase-like pyridoxal phosphate-dependent protein